MPYLVYLKGEVFPCQSQYTMKDVAFLKYQRENVGHKEGS